MNTSDCILKGVRGQMLTFKADPFFNSEKDCYDYYSDGLLVILDGRIAAIGDYDDIAPVYPGLKDVDEYHDALIVPGFVDCHTHYVQLPMIGSYGDTLLDWLDR